MGHREEALVGEKDMLLKQIEFRDQFIEVHKDYSPMKWFMQLFLPCLLAFQEASPKVEYGG